VTSERKIKANRANASSSTGPKTRYGRIRSARNALRHGLSLPIQVNPVLCEEARSLASQIAGPDASVYITALAHRVAE
jgi:fumarate hydratase class II